MKGHPAIAIPNLLATYAMRFDDGDFAGAAALFDKGAVIVGGQHIAGCTAILALWQQWVKTYDGKPLTRHLVTNPIIALDDSGDAATCQSQWTVLQAAISSRANMSRPTLSATVLPISSNFWPRELRHHGNLR